MQVITSEKNPIKIWTDTIEESALIQAKELANLPFIFKHVAIMPDTHMGYGMPIGGVIATHNVVIPNAVGVDIGCGMKARKTNLTDISKETLRKVLNQIQRDIPTGFNHQKVQQKVPDELMEMTTQLSYDNIKFREIVNKMPEQLGTLGGGNHFIEIQKGDDGFIWIMLHSGSRGIGKMTCDYYNDMAIELNKKWYSYSAKELAFLPSDSVQGMEYLQAMRIGMRFAEENRLHMLEKITNILMDNFPDMKYEEAIDTHHNYASLESHFGKNVLVHRKGAVRAVGKVIIPGSMGSFSYIGEGLQNPDSFWSCPHGAGRKMGRNTAKKTFTAQSVIEQMKKDNIELYKQKKEDVAEECVGAYKDIDQVIKDSETLIKPLVKLKPLGVIKG